LPCLGECEDRGCHTQYPLEVGVEVYSPPSHVAPGLWPLAAGCPRDWGLGWVGGCGWGPQPTGTAGLCYIYITTAATGAFRSQLSICHLWPGACRTKDQNATANWGARARGQNNTTSQWWLVACFGTAMAGGNVRRGRGRCSVRAAFPAIKVAHAACHCYCPWCLQTTEVI
jgi:hypothetical protein